MKKLALVMLMAISVLCSSAQRQKEKKTAEPKQDETVLSVTYDCYFQRVMEVKKREKDLMRLDIGKHSSQFVSPIHEWIKKNKYIYNKEKPVPYTTQGYTTLRNWVYKNTPKQGFMYFIHDPGWIATRDKTEGLFTWELLKGDTVVCGYPCKKARTTFRYRTWTVWYTLDLPYSDGPWKFCGLPGLVLYAYDSEGYFCFNCIGIEKGDGHEIKLRTPKNGVLDVYMPRRAQELMMLEHWDKFAFNDAIMPPLFTSSRTISITTPDGKTYRPGELKPQTAILYEKVPGVDDVKKKYPQKKKATKKK